MKNDKNKRLGYTLVELIVVIGLFSTFFGVIAALIVGIHFLAKIW